MVLNQLDKKTKSRDLEYLRAILVRWAHYAAQPQVQKRLLASNQKWNWCIMPRNIISKVTRDDLRKLASENMSINAIGERRVKALKASS